MSQAYSEEQSQQPCLALGSAVAKVFDSVLICTLPYHMNVEDLDDIVGQRCNKCWEGEGTWHLPAKSIALHYVCACT